jgi:hypothetical protein
MDYLMNVGVILFSAQLAIYPQACHLSWVALELLANYSRIFLRFCI